LNCLINSISAYRPSLIKPIECHLPLSVVTAENAEIDGEIAQSFPHYGLLSLNARTQFLHAQGNPAVNLGDEVQGLASSQWLPYIDHFVERDNLTDGVKSKLASSINVFMNAWWGSPAMTWPPPESLAPVMLAMHIEPSAYELFSTQPAISYFQKHQPIGARDQGTLDFLQTLNISSFLSYCMTLTFKAIPPAEEGCKFLIVDVPVAHYGDIPKHVRAQSCNATARFDDGGSGEKFNGIARYTRAFELLQRYAGASAIITSRLHCALPAAALGKPVVLFLSDKMPGGGGNKDKNQRFSGFQDLIYFVDFLGDNWKNRLEYYPWETPPANNEAVIRQTRCQIYNHIAAHHQHLLDALHFFDLNAFSVCY
jgi:hypothetical protein